MGYESLLNTKGGKKGKLGRGVVQTRGETKLKLKNT